MTIVLRCSQPPPSVNKAWRLRTNPKTKQPFMSRSTEFKAWEKLALEEFAASARKSNEWLPEHCYWSTKIFVPVIRYRPDIDNMPKACHDAIVRAKLAPDDFYLVQTRLEYWAGSYLIIHLTEEPLEKWEAILKTTKDTKRKILRSRTDRNSPRLV